MPVLYPVKVWEYCSITILRRQGKIFSLTLANTAAAPMGLLGSVTDFGGRNLSTHGVPQVAWKWGLALTHMLGSTLPPTTQPPAHSLSSPSPPWSSATATHSSHSSTAVQRERLGHIHVPTYLLWKWRESALQHFCYTLVGIRDLHWLKWMLWIALIVNVRMPRSTFVSLRMYIFMNLSRISTRWYFCSLYRHCNGKRWTRVNLPFYRTHTQLEMHWLGHHIAI